jgi:PAS domain S-box-containing protein
MSQIAKKSDEQKGAEAEVESFRKDLGPFVVAAETTRMAMVFTDATEPDNPIIFANDSFLSLTGYGREEVLGKSFHFLMTQGADAEALARIKAEFDGSSNTGTEILYRRNMKNWPRYSLASSSRRSRNSAVSIYSTKPRSLCGRRRIQFLPMTSTATPVSAAAKQQHQNNYNKDQFHRKSP